MRLNPKSASGVLLSSLLAMWPAAAAHADSPPPFIPLSQALGPAPAPTPNPATSAPATPATPTTFTPMTPGPAASGAALTGANLAFWNTHWKRVAMLYAVLDGHYFVAPRFDLRYPSSNHVQVDQYLAQHTTQQQVVSAGMVRHESSAPPRAEGIAAANCLPDFTAGAYGHVFCAKVVKILGPEEMIVSDVQVLDPKIIDDAKTKLARAKALAQAQEQQQRIAQQRRIQEQGYAGGYTGNYSSSLSSGSLSRDFDKQFKNDFALRQKLYDLQNRAKGTQLHVVGFSTATLAPGSIWKSPDPLGPQLVLLPDPVPGQPLLAPPPEPKPTTGSHFTFTHFTGGRQNLLALNGALFGHPMTEPQFDALLKEAGLDRAGFCELARQTMRETRQRDADYPAIALALEAARAKAKAAATTPSSDGKTAATPTSDWLKQKYQHSPGTPGTPPATTTSDWLKQKYQKTTPGTPGASTNKPATPATDWFKQKYQKTAPANTAPNTTP